MTTGSEFEIRPAEPTEACYREIMSACFGRAPDERYFEWKYSENPAGKVVGFEAISGDQIAGFYGVIPWYLNVGNKTLRVFQSMDTMTHPSFQRRGLFLKLAQATYSALESQNGDCVIIGVPGSTSYPGFVHKLGWTHVFDAQYIFKPRIFGRKGPGVGSAVRALNGMDPALRRYLANRSSVADHFRVSLDPAFLDWRVFKNPLASYETLLVESGSQPLGVSVVRQQGPGRVFLELLDAISPDAWGEVIEAVTAHLFQTRDVSVVFTWRPADERRAAAFSRAFFVRNPFRRGPFSYRVPFIVRSALSTLEGLPLRDAKSFDLQPLVQD